VVNFKVFKFYDFLQNYTIYKSISVASNGRRKESKNRRRFKARGGLQTEESHQRNENVNIGEKTNGCQNRNLPRYNEHGIGFKLPLTGEEPITLVRELYSFLVRVQDELQSLSDYSAESSNRGITGDARLSSTGMNVRQCRELYSASVQVNSVRIRFPSNDQLQTHFWRISQVTNNRDTKNTSTTNS